MSSETRRKYEPPTATLIYGADMKRPSLARVEELCAKHNGTCPEPCEACDLVGEVTSLLRLLRIVAESEPPLEPTPPAGELEPYECLHAEETPRTLLVTCKSEPPSRAELLEQSRLCAVCAGRVILLLQSLTERTHG